MPLTLDLSEYLPILIFLGVALALSSLFVFLPMGVARLTGVHGSYGPLGPASGAKGLPRPAGGALGPAGRVRVVGVSDGHHIASRSWWRSPSGESRLGPWGPRETAVGVIPAG